MPKVFCYPFFKLDALNGFVALAILLFSLLTGLYSLKLVRGKARVMQYYTYIILTAIASVAAVLSNNLILLLSFWGFLGLTLYLLINMAGTGAAAAAKKTFIIVGGSDALMLIGIAIIYYLAQSLQMDKITLSLDNGLAISAYLCIAVACFAKAGAMPFHSWIPDCAEVAPAAVVAYLPASLDKLLGIYLLSRISLNLFVMTPAMNLLLMLIGAFTIIAAVMMALIQHNMRRLLGYHAVSQVGYMVLGIGSGTAIGVAGGIFHMLNHAIYKSCLFFGAGNVEYRAETAELDKLGGLARPMPLTYIATLVASLSISGIPPFNGFVSKWMIYQGVLEKLWQANYAAQVAGVLCLAAAMFGSGLTLASFTKLLHAVFLGQRTERQFNKKIVEVPWTMWLPGIILAALCVIFGVFARQVPLKYFIIPASGQVSFLGSWYSGLATLLILVGFLLGILVFRAHKLRQGYRTDSAFVGGEPEDFAQNPVTGTEFYNTVQERALLWRIYAKAKTGAFDIYEQGKTVIFGIGKFLGYLHNGVLPTYLVWTLLGMVGLFFTLLKK